MAPPENCSPKKNLLLASLPENDYERLLPLLEPRVLKLGEIIHFADEKMRQVYFPLDSIISMIYTLEDGATAEIAVIGHEGVGWVSAFMGGEPMPNQAIVQHEGECLCMDTSILKQEFSRGQTLQRVLLYFTQALITQMSQTAVCYRHHSVDQQLCRWLLLCLDRLPSNELIMTQGMIGRMLGVRREGVTRAAGKLQEAGLIRYQHGRIVLLDRPGLEQRVCECYGVVQKAYKRLLPPTGMPQAELPA